MNMALVIDANAVAVPASRSGRSRAASRPSSHRSTWARETRLGSPPMSVGRASRDRKPASLMAARLASRMRRLSQSQHQACGGRTGGDDETSQRLPPERLDSATSDATAAPGPPGRLPESCRACSPAASAATRPPVDQPWSTTWLLEAKLSDERRHEASVEIWRVARVDTERRCGPQSSPGGRQRPPGRAASGEERGRSTCSRCRSSGARAGEPVRRAARSKRDRADVVHGHAAHARRDAAQPCPLRRSDAPVVVPHGLTPSVTRVVAAQVKATMPQDGP